MNAFRSILRAMTLVVACMLTSLLAQEHRLALFTEGGVPAAAAPVTILVNSGYAVGYSDDFKCPLWAVYRVGNRKGEPVNTQWERTERFEVDHRTTSKVTHDDYVRNWDGTTWDRGHMVPNAVMEIQYGQMAQLETFLMSNICPQTSQLNQGLWADLEEEIRTGISQEDTKNKEVHNVWVIAGPIFEKVPADRWPKGIAVPTHCFMIVAYKRGYRDTLKAAAFIFPQKPADGSTIQDHAVTVREVEDRTGINFFPELTKTVQNNLETVKRDIGLEELP